LDLQGGAHLVYQADTSALGFGEVSDAMNGLRDVIERRVNAFGVSEPLVQTQSVGQDRRLIVELAGVFDIKEAIRIIGATPFLEFRELNDEARELLSQKNDEQPVNFTSFIPTQLTGRYLKNSAIEFDSNTGKPSIALRFDDEGARIFEEITERNVGLPLAIFLDGFPISSPVVQQKISGGQAQITGRFTLPEAKELVRDLNTGALPVPIELISQQSVAASLGNEALSRSLIAAIYGTIAVMIFMVLWYRLSGIVAVVALGVYGALTLLLFKLIPVTLSSAGIAGFILSVGMAVDANILIFERMKEERILGKPLGLAMAEGFKRAWTSIRDSNISSLITAAILYWFGTSLVRGFALTLSLGIVVSMFTAITATRYFLNALPHKTENKFTRFLFGTGIRMN
ncbi:MAG TPA: protein translocase subunit SecD, partial [Candidatus Paceibacterota bacterium]